MRMIERWFPCEEVSRESARGWGSGNAEKALFTWFAARPIAQARAAVLTSLLPWPDDEAEQTRLQELVRRAMSGRDEAHDEVVGELARHYPDGAFVIDPFSGRGMIPLEAARYGIKAWGTDYSPVATVAGHLLADYPMRDWSGEPDLPFPGYIRPMSNFGDRLASDVAFFLRLVGQRFTEAMAPFYPAHNGKQPWGYLWAVTLPCEGCEKRFPLTGSLLLRNPSMRKGTRYEGQSYRIDVDKANGTYTIIVHDGPPIGKPTRVVAQGKNKFDSSGKVVVCPFCEHVHPKEVHTRLAAEGKGEDTLLLVADLDPTVSKLFRVPTEKERAAAEAAKAALLAEPDFPNGLPAVPQETIPPGNTWTIQPQVYGAKTFGDLCCTRQTLSFVRLCRVIADMGCQMQRSGISCDYATALCSYAVSVMVRKMKYSTRGAVVQVKRDGDAKVNHIFGSSESSIGFSYDFFESGIGEGASTWWSLIDDTVRLLEKWTKLDGSRAATVRRISATGLPLRAESVDAVVTDPPYDSMIEYADASDLFYVWMKRALCTTLSDFAITMDANGTQEKDEEAIVKKGGGKAFGDHRTPEHYDRTITQAFAEARRVTKPDGVVTIVFGHGDPQVWHRLLKAIGGAGLFLTGSWPAQTETGAGDAAANITTTLTMCCRPAPPNRPVGKHNEVAVLVEREVRARIPLWERSGLALTDQLMASAGPAMETVGRYSEILDRRGEPVGADIFLLLARKAVQEAANIEIDHLPLQTFDTRTQFALFWLRLYGRRFAPKSEARWQAMVAGMNLPDLKGILHESTDGARLAFAAEASKASKRGVDTDSATIDVALALAAAWEGGMDAAGEVLARAGRDKDDNFLWAALGYLCARLPDGDPDKAIWTSLQRARLGLRVVATTTQTQQTARENKEKAIKSQMTLSYDGPADALREGGTTAS